ncbi:MAG: zinc ribbon domain-containing protein [Chloroflexi bacterium]|nr:MAG: zinc ribbon domain-containing protein [Chloroflexota bacterium]
MPIYEYVCQECGTRFEALRPMKDADVAITCKKCHGSNTQRALSLFNATSGGQTLAASGGCGNCAGGSCSSCGHH